MNAQSDMSGVIIPKSDQINADDLVAGPMTITINDVQIRGGQEQPVSIFFDGSEKAFRPCKSMSRCLVLAWGPDASKYIGRSLTLYRDASVKWGGLEVGGIRISHMSDLDGPKTMMLTATKGSRKPHKVSALVIDQAPATVSAADKWANGYVTKLDSFTTIDALEKFANEKAGKLAELQTARSDLHGKVTAALDLRRSQLAGDGFDDFDTHPAQAAADAMRVEFRAAIDTAALTALWSRHGDAILAMPDEIGAALEADFNAVRASLAERKVEA
jgi:hypothetical protein